MNVILDLLICYWNHSPKTWRKTKENIREFVSKLFFEPLCLFERTISCSRISNRSPEILHGEAKIKSPLIFAPMTIVFPPVWAENENKTDLQQILGRFSVDRLCFTENRFLDRWIIDKWTQQHRLFIPNNSFHFSFDFRRFVQFVFVSKMNRTSIFDVRRVLFFSTTMINRP